jgi:hypothetical protein
VEGSAVSVAGHVVRSIGGDWRNRGVEERYAFPEDWSLREYRVREIPALTGAEVASRIAAPFGYRGGSARIAELARGKSDVIVLFDDLSRWTPASALVPALLAELARAGVAVPRIRFLAATGSHRAMSRADMALKLGRDTVERYAVGNHDCWREDAVELGTGRYGTPIRLNRDVVEADLVICLGMITRHGFAYTSGGAKMILPGVAHVDTIRRNHRSRTGGHFEPSELVGDEEERKYGPIRTEMNQAAEMLLGRTEVVSINISMNREREVAGVFLGDPLSVFRENADALMEPYRVPFDRKDKADIGVFRVDNLDPLQYYKGVSWSKEVCDHRIVVGDFSDRYIYQGQRHGPFEQYMKLLQEHGPIPNAPLCESLRAEGTVFLCSPHLDTTSTKLFSPAFHIVTQWGEFVAELRRELGPGRRVAFFPDSFLQILEVR